MTYEFIADHEKDLVMVREVGTGTATLLPRFLPWAEVDRLPKSLLSALNLWSNVLEYRDSSYLSQKEITHETLPTWLGPMAASYGINRDDRILDYGTGMGGLRLGLLRDGFHNTFGVDVSEDCLLRQSEWSVRLGLCSEAEKMKNLFTGDRLRDELEALSGSFSMIIASSVLHHLADLPAFLESCRRLLRSGGRLVAFNEPINKTKWHGLAGDAIVVDLFDFAGPEGIRPGKKTPSTTRFAEVWDGQGFEKAKFEKMLTEARFRLTTWNPGMWLSYICNHMARKYLAKPADPSQRSEFNDIYAELIKLENRLKPLLQEEFRHENFFTVSIVAEAC